VTGEGLASYLVAEVIVEWLPDDCRECVGGVGGKPGTPILLGACFKVRGLDASELVEDNPVSMMRSRGFVTGIEEIALINLPARGCGNVLCLFNNVVPTA